MTLDTIHYWAVRGHVIPGAVAMVIGPAAMVARKGGWWHRLWGRIFVWSILVALVAGVPLAIEVSDYFLFCLTLVIFYLTVSGYRIHILKRRNYRAGVVDWIGVAVVAVAGVVATGMGLEVWGVVSESEMHTVMLAMGLGVILQAAVDLYRLVRPPRHRMAWWFIHMSRMLSAYVAGVSAVSVVQFHFLPTTIRWLWAMAIGGPGILLWVGYYRYKFRAAQGPSMVHSVPGEATGA